MHYLFCSESNNQIQSIPKPHVSPLAEQVGGHVQPSFTGSVSGILFYRGHDKVFQYFLHSATKAVKYMQGGQQTEFQRPIHSTLSAGQYFGIAASETMFIPLQAPGYPELNIMIILYNYVFCTLSLTKENLLLKYTLPLSRLCIKEKCLNQCQLTIRSCIQEHCPGISRTRWIRLISFLVRVN